MIFKKNKTIKINTLSRCFPHSIKTLIKRKINAITSKTKTDIIAQYAPPPLPVKFILEKFKSHLQSQSAPL